MAIYYIDGDNELKKRLKGIEWLSECNSVYIFYADTNTYFCADRNRKSIEEEVRAAVQFEKTGTGKNATDFAIAIHAAMTMQMYPGESFYLISGDKDFSTIETFLKRFDCKMSSIKLISVVWQGIVENWQQIESLEVVEAILKEQFGIDAGQNVYEAIQSLLYRKFQSEHSKRRERKWNLTTLLKKSV